MEYLTNDVELTSIAEAIREKGGTSDNLVYPDGFVSAINNIPTGGGGDSVESGVVFIDYDGSIVESWESSSVASKTSLPANPTHAGLVGEGWNWSLTNIQSYISAYPNAKVMVGQMYHTASGLTEMDITVTKITGLTVTCKMAGNKNWGDGIKNSSTTHTYTDYGDYTITCNGTTIPAGTSTSGGLFGSSSSNNNRYLCTAIRISDSVTSIGSNAFTRCYSITTITIPDSVTSLGERAVYYCTSLTTITIPDSITSISNNVLDSCFSLTTITIPDSVTSIGNSAFSGCGSLTTMTIPNSVTSIGDSVFYSCNSLTTMIIPNSVTSIGGSVFNNCYPITKYDFTALTAIPTLSNTNPFNGINGICKIIVPDALYDNWKVAQNWATYADYIYKASEVA